MTIIAKTLIFSAAILAELGILLAPFANFGNAAQIHEEFESMDASQKGFEILGAIVNTRHAYENIVLVKYRDSNKTAALAVGSVMNLDDNYTILMVQTDYIEVQGSHSKLRLYKYGFTPETTAKPKGLENKPVDIVCKNKEEGFECEGHTITVSRDYVDDKLKHELPTILNQAASEPKLDASGNIVGFGLYDIDPKSIFAKSGIQDGDVIKNINGTDFDSAVGAVKTLNSLRSANEIHILIERGGQTVPLDINVK